MLAQVHEIHARMACFARAVRQHVARVAPFARVLQRLQRRRRGAENHGHVLPPRAHHGEVAGRVAKAFLLLVRAIVFLIDDDHARACERRKDRRARADQDGGFTTPRAPPRASGARLRSGSECSTASGASKRSCEALHQLRSQADLRHQHQRLATRAPASLLRCAGTPRSCRCRLRRRAARLRTARPPARRRPRPAPGHR